MQTFNPRSHMIRPNLISSQFYLHFLHRKFLGISDKRFFYAEALPIFPWELFNLNT